MTASANNLSLAATGEKPWPVAPTVSNQIKATGENLVKIHAA
jgi:hypothetical protein